MATILYRDGNAERIAPEHVTSSLANGYFLTREESLGEEPEGTDEDDSLVGADETGDGDETGEVVPDDSVAPENSEQGDFNEPENSAEL